MSIGAVEGRSLGAQAAPVCEADAAARHTSPVPGTLRAQLLEAAQAEHELLVRQGRRDSAAFVSGLFGYDLAEFQVDWHRTIAEHQECVIFSPIEHGKTQQLSIAYPIWRLGRNAKERILLVGSTASQAEKSVATIRRLIDEEPFVREVFPKLRPLAGKYAKWTDQAVKVEGCAIGEKDYSLASCGVGGPILGARLTGAILDDVLDFENTRTLSQRKKLIDWFQSTLLGRLVEGAFLLIVGNAWFPDDLMHDLEKRGIKVHRREAYRPKPDGTIDPASIIWPAQWSHDRLTKRLAKMTTIEADRQFRCKAYSSGQGQFQLEWFDAAFEAGREYTFEPHYRGPWPTFGGVDLGVQEKRESDETVFWVIAVDPLRGTRRVIWVESGRMEGPEIIDRLVELDGRYGPSWMVENVAAQAYIEQFARAKGVAVQGFTTGKQKADPAFGVPSLAVELKTGMWIIPAHEETFTWRSECLSYKPGDHTGDRLMASWFARESARGGTFVAGETVEPEGENNVDYGRLRGRYDGAGTRGRVLRFGRPVDNEGDQDGD